MDRLQKVIAQAGVASRRKAEELIAEGRVSVDGQVITEMGYQVKKGQLILVDGKAIEKEEHEYYVINKPRKYLCSVKDDRGRNCVGDLIETDKRIFPVGRLDYESSGLLLMTNDGDFTNLMIHPRFHIKKTYLVTIKGVMEPEHVKVLERGVELDGVRTLPCKIRITSKDMKIRQTTMEIVLQEGRNRQIRRMMELFGYEVTLLHRKQFGVITDSGLRAGQYRRLKPFELKQLRELADQGKTGQ
ncbi:MAG: rRNA pseudouridine synthase [Erysipelotrichaceae bacterium]|nr:rRNA pseudouridine synthase [Erysipelotrichaceae bacterium]